MSTKTSLRRKPTGLTKCYRCNGKGFVDSYLTNCPECDGWGAVLPPQELPKKKRKRR